MGNPCYREALSFSEKEGTRTVFETKSFREQDSGLIWGRCQNTKGLGLSFDFGDLGFGSRLGKASEAKAGLMGTVIGLSLGITQNCLLSKSGTAFERKARSFCSCSACLLSFSCSYCCAISCLLRETNSNPSGIVNSF